MLLRYILDILDILDTIIKLYVMSLLLYFGENSISNMKSQSEIIIIKSFYHQGISHSGMNSFQISYLLQLTCLPAVLKRRDLKMRD